MCRDTRRWISNPVQLTYSANTPKRRLRDSNSHALADASIQRWCIPISATRRQIYKLGWRDSDPRNTGVKVLCLTAWRQPIIFLLCYFLFLSICASIPLLNFFNDSASGRIFSGTFTSLALPPLFAISFSSIFLISDIFFCLVFCIFWQCSFSPCVIADLQTIHPHHG